PNVQVFQDVIDALAVLQDEYFQPWIGTWPSSIDWTAAVMGSHVAGTLETLSRGLSLVRLPADEDYRVKENLISQYFSQLVGYYFGQDYFAIRNEAYDDILWVVLGWLDAIHFINMHNERHYQLGSLDVEGLQDPTEQISMMLRNQSWQGSIWTPAFAHRARTFWDLASTGWDTKLCGGGMNWNPRLEPYKNAITNELFISGSIAMYLYFPGDNNSAPFGAEGKKGAHRDPPTGQEWKAHDPKYLAAAVDGYKWLTTVGMANEYGLYADGFHVSGYKDPNNNNTKCDQRDNMVYTYNQGVVLSGVLGLFQATGSASYLEDGHKLIQSVINATGYDLRRDSPVDDLTGLQPGQLPPWYGLGRAGILEEVCDARGDCSQDSQTFKGIFFHHFVTFCSPLELSELSTATLQASELKSMQVAHLAACQRYLKWLGHNAAAALATRDAKGKFGMWWTVGLLKITLDKMVIEPDTIPHEDHAVDYRTYGVPNDPVWVPNAQTPFREDIARPGDALNQQPIGEATRGKLAGLAAPASVERRAAPQDSDPNNRGRGRTVETQGGGLAVLRALWEISN
ncbi:Six-hairpin glycosidase, partial [Thozetella sp. PMI_491]